MRKFQFLIRAALCSLLVLLPLASMDQWFYDRFFRLRGSFSQPSAFLLVRVNDARLHVPPPPSETLVPMESRSFRTRPLGTWQGDIYDPLLQRIQADQPQLIIFTSYYETVNDSDRTRLSRQRFAQNILYSGLLSDEGKLVPPSPQLTTGDNYGFANLFPDPDNVVRRSRLVYSSGSSLALRAYQRISDVPVARDLLDSLWIDFRGPAGSYPSVDASDILDDAMRPGKFTGRIVIIGREESPAAFYETPFGKMSRMEIQTNTIDTFLSHREIRMLPRAVTLMLGLVAVAISITLILLFPLTLAWLLLLLQALLFVLFALFAFAQLKVWAGIATPVFCIFGTHLVMLGYKLGKQEEQQWKIQQEAETLKEMDQFKNNFISLFSHDLKTPIAKIKAIVERVLVDDRSLVAGTRDSLRNIERANGELQRLISDILKVTKMESMKMEPAKEVLDLNRLVEVAAQRLKFMADEKRIAIVLDLEPLFSMEGDPQLIGEVITNLLENGVKYTGEGGKVIVRTKELEGRVCVAVIDSGIGIAADEIPRVTGKFYRGRAVTDGTKGSGLGLYLAKYFVELHGGGLDIHSEVGRGTEVSFWLPLAG